MKIAIRHSFTKKVDHSGNLRVFINYDFKETSKLSADLIITFFAQEEKLTQVKTHLILEAGRDIKKAWSGFVYFDLDASMVKKITEIKWRLGPYSGQAKSAAPFEDLTKVTLKTPFMKGLFDQIVNN